MKSTLTILFILIVRAAVIQNYKKMIKKSKKTALKIADSENRDLTVPGLIISLDGLVLPFYHVIDNKTDLSVENISGDYFHKNIIGRSRKPVMQESRHNFKKNIKMKKFIIFLVLITISSCLKAQSISSVRLLNEADSIDIAMRVGASINTTTASKRTSSSTGQGGFVIHTKARKFGGDLRFTQILVDFNTIIIGFDPWNFNALIKQSADSFYTQKMPYSEDCLLHIGLKRNFIKGQFMTEGKQKYVHSLFADLYWRPYFIERRI